MKFAIATVEFWRSVGFDTTKWRKSIDETLALVHLQYAKVLVDDIKNNENIEIYDAHDTKFINLLKSEIWTEIEEDEETEEP